MNAILKKNNIKSTMIREDILKLFDANDELSIQDIKDSLDYGDLSTIYRTLDLFLDKKIIIKLVNDNKFVYSLKEKHNHYLSCIKCHKKVRVDMCPFDKYDYNGFKIINHTLFIEGICKNCQEK